ncbi:adenylyltransferase and sulfurtransferase [Mytilus galloprovincialis]|uniref:Adenylyltransferase and sulfurtransferase n=1 Tax=Mytilus galloprovincialis TaxID=29158 RepID=A0A8B6GTX7_MYTGA|nr:adenylyltransferase and sulfurtransferase [Mytilus galloprovincialis]
MIKHNIADLQKQINEKQKELDNLKEMLNTKSEFRNPSSTVEALDCLEKSDNLSNEQIGRYSRQLILPEIGVKGQLSLSRTSVLIVGAGGLGCPSAVYLAAAGVGRIGIVDYDEVELNNLHRQILHTEKRVGTPKSSSVASSCTQLNSLVECIPYHLQLDSTNALRLIKQYDVVLDATDNVATRYLLNDACILANKPLVSGSALRFEGQLTIYNYEGGPCYRCLYPKPPPPETVTNCSDGGVLGVIPGIIGCMQALEAIKICAGIDRILK